VSSNEREFWRGKLFRFIERDVVLSDGNMVPRGMVDHPGAVIVVPLLRSDILMLRQYRFSVDQEVLELPAGTIDPGESTLECAGRELREESGYRAETLTPLGSFWASPGYTNELMHFYLAEDLVHDPLPQDDDEEIEVAAMPFDRLLSMALTGELMDSKSVVGIVRAAVHLKRLLHLSGDPGQ